MPDEEKPRHAEINFLPPLDMILCFFKKKDKQHVVNDQEPEEVKKEVKRLIERINTEDELKTKRLGDQQPRD